MKWIEVLSASVSALAAVLAVLMAGWTVVESRRLREAQTAPEVVVYLTRNDRVRRIVDLVISNIGHAPALNVRFETPVRPIPFALYHGHAESMYVLQHGINFLAPSQTFRFSINAYPDLPKDEITVNVSYFAKGEVARGEPRRDSFQLRPMEFEGFAEWQDREREGWIALKKGMDALIQGKITVRIGDKR